MSCLPAQLSSAPCPLTEFVWDAHSASTGEGVTLEQEPVAEGEGGQECFLLWCVCLNDTRALHRHSLAVTSLAWPSFPSLEKADPIPVPANLLREGAQEGWWRFSRCLTYFWVSDLGSGRHPCGNVQIPWTCKGHLGVFSCFPNSPHCTLNPSFEKCFHEKRLVYL